MVVNNLQRAKEHGAATIAITSYEDVPLGAYADIVLMTVNNDNVKFGIEPSCATVTQMILLDCIYIMIYLLDKEKSDSYVEVTLEAINQEKI